MLTALYFSLIDLRLYYLKDLSVVLYPRLRTWGAVGRAVVGAAAPDSFIGSFPVCVVI